MLPLRRLCMLPRLGARYLADNKSSRGQFPVANIHKKDVDEVIDPKEPPTKLSVKDEQAEAYYLSGVPDEKIEERFVRIYQPTREATQSGLANTKSWKIDFGEKERWENPLIGWSSSGDPLSNSQMALEFASKEDAIRFCETNHYKYEIAEPNERLIYPKTYSENYSWNRRTRVQTK